MRALIIAAAFSVTGLIAITTAIHIGNRNPSDPIVGRIGNSSQEEGKVPVDVVPMSPAVQPVLAAQIGMYVTKRATWLCESMDALHSEVGTGSDACSEMAAGQQVEITDWYGDFAATPMDTVDGPASFYLRADDLTPGQ